MGNHANDLNGQRQRRDTVTTSTIKAELLAISKASKSVF